MQNSHKYFAGGYRSDGDSNDLPGDSLSDGQNVDIDVSIGEVTTRTSVSQYHGIDDIHSGVSVYGIPPTTLTGNVICTHVFRWDSGIATVVHNTMVVFRSASITSGVNYTWEIQSNAPSGGEGYAWTVLETGLLAPSLRLTANRGQVRIALGNAVHMRIFMNLCDAGSITLFKTATNAVTITSATTTSYGTGIGDGGKVYKGWLYDHARHYWGNMWDDTSSIVIAGTTSTTNPLDAAQYEFAVCLVLDDQPQSFGLVKYFFIDKRYFILNPQGNIVFDVTINPLDTSYSKRLRYLAFYVKKTNTVLDSDADYRRCFMLDIQDPNITFPYTFRYDIQSINETVGVWSVDGDERPMINGKPTLTTYAWGTLNRYPVNSTEATKEEDAISVKATGLMFRKETLYAWGTDTDSGQERIRFTSMGERRGMLDIWYKLNWGVKDVGKAITFMCEYNDKLFGTYENNCWYVDVTDRLYVENRRDYMSHKEGMGIGLPLTMATSGIIKSVAGLFWRNYNSIYKFTGSIPVDILENRWRKEYQAFTPLARETAVMGYCEARHELWVAIRDSADSTVGTGDETYKIFTWRDKAGSMFWQPPYRITNFVPMGFTNDTMQKFVMWGRWANQNPPATFPILFLDPDTNVDYYTSSIECYFVTQSQGERSEEYVIDGVDVQRKIIAGASTIDVSLFPNRATTAWGNSIKFSPSRNKMARVHALRCNEYKAKVAWTHAGTDTERAVIRELTIFGEQEVKRRT